MSDPIDTGTVEGQGQPLEDGTQQPDFGQPETEGAAEQPQAGAESSEDIGPEHKSYKEIQRAFTEKSQKLKDIESKFQAFGGVDQASQLAQFIQQRPAEFQQWLQQQTNPQEKQEEEPDIYSQLGLGNDIDEESKRGIDLVNKIAEMRAKNITEQKIEPLQKELQGLIQQNKVERIRGYLGELRKDPDFSDIDEYKESMVEIAGMLAPEKRDDLSIDDMKDLYFLAVRKSGKWDEKIKQDYEKRLSQKKAQSQEKPDASAGQSGKKQAKTLEEAFALAKKETGFAF